MRNSCDTAETKSDCSWATSSSRATERPTNHAPLTTTRSRTPRPPTSSWRRRADWASAGPSPPASVTVHGRPVTDDTRAAVVAAVSRATPAIARPSESARATPAPAEGSQWASRNAGLAAKMAIAGPADRHTSRTGPEAVFIVRRPVASFAADRRSFQNDSTASETARRLAASVSVVAVHDAIRDERKPKVADETAHRPEWRSRARAVAVRSSPARSCCRS